MRNIVIGLVVVGLSALSVGCKSQGTDTEADADKLQIEELQGRNSELDQQLAATKARLIEALKRLNDAEQSAAAAPQPSEVADGSDEGFTPGRTAEGFQCIRIGDEILFASGRAEIRKEGEAVLKKVAELVKSKWAGHTIRIDGHTDNDPIHKSAKLFQDNWHLSALRGLTVLRFLVKQGVPAEKIYVAGFGESRPLEPNDSRAHKSKNRRVEVVVVD